MNAIAQTINQSPTGAAGQGKVTLVGAGPGAADLITLRGAAVLADADVVFADGLIGDDLRGLASSSVRWVDAAKRVGAPTLSQQEIVDAMIKEARNGAHVVRLKGGDISLFARGGEEISGLQSAGIKVELVPGVTAASGAAAAGAFSLTHRDFSSAVTFLTGHNKDEDLPDLDGIVDGRQTLVVYMGLGTSRTLSTSLIDRGYAPSTAVAVIEKASHADERILYGTLRTLPDVITGQDIKSPALIVIGDVVRTSRGWWRDEKSIESVETSSPQHFAHG